MNNVKKAKECINKTKRFGDFPMTNQNLPFFIIIINKYKKIISSLKMILMVQLKLFKTMFLPLEIKILIKDFYLKQKNISKIHLTFLFIYNSKIQNVF